jgi:hypothetical protein
MSVYESVIPSVYTALREKNNQRLAPVPPPLPPYLIRNVKIKVRGTRVEEKKEDMNNIFLKIAYLTGLKQNLVSQQLRNEYQNQRNNLIQHVGMGLSLNEINRVNFSYAFTDPRGGLVKDKAGNLDNIIDAVQKQFGYRMKIVPKVGSTEIFEITPTNLLAVYQYRPKLLEIENSEIKAQSLLHPFDVYALGLKLKDEIQYTTARNLDDAFVLIDRYFNYDKNAFKRKFRQMTQDSVYAQLVPLASGGYGKIKIMKYGYPLN